LRLHVSILRSARIETEAGGGDFDIGLSMRFLDMPVEEDGAPGDDGRIRLRREPLTWVAHSSIDISSLNRLPLIVMTDACSLRRLVVKSLDRHGVDFEIAHSASGVMGMQLALAAGLGISCLNASAVPPEMICLDGDARLPKMPDAEFSLLPPRAGEPTVVTEVRQMLTEQLA
jgi:DNA-binding transcriptional LysR family regulator